MRVRYDFTSGSATKMVRNRVEGVRDGNTR